MNDQEFERLCWYNGSRSSNFFEDVKDYLKNDSFIDKRYFNGNTIYHLIAKSGNLQCFEMLSECGGIINITNTKGDIPLHYAVQAHCPTGDYFLNFINGFLESNSDPNLTNGNNYTSLGLISGGTRWFSSKFSVMAMKLLIKYDANPYIPQGNAGNLLHCVSNKDALGFALSLGIDPNTLNANGESPLMKYALYGPDENVIKLLESGVDPNHVDNDGWTALHYLVSEIECNKKVFDFLVTYGADINAKTNDGATPLHVAIANGSKKAVKLIMNYNPDIKSKDNNGLDAIDFINSVDSPFENQNYWQTIKKDIIKTLKRNNIF